MGKDEKAKLESRNEKLKCKESKAYTEVTAVFRWPKIKSLRSRYPLRYRLDQQAVEKCGATTQPSREGCLLFVPSGGYLKKVKVAFKTRLMN